MSRRRKSVLTAAGAAAVFATAVVLVVTSTVGATTKRAIDQGADPTTGRAATLAAPPTGAVPSVVAPSLVICSFDGTRSRAPFATATGFLGYGHMRASLLDPSNFGPSGK